MNWKATVTNPEEVEVFRALDNPTSTWRTTSAIARQTGLPEMRVAEILRRYDLTLTRRYTGPSISGQDLVGLIEKVGDEGR